MASLGYALAELVGVLDRLKIAYLIGGSLASSARGVLRATMDVDVLIHVARDDASRLAAVLGEDWYADAEALSAAFRSGRAYNIIHLASGNKFDLFPASCRFHESELERATLVDLDLPGRRVSCRVATAEDILLAKLEWFRAGGGVSERQWKDILGLVAANPGLDEPYLAEWSGPSQTTELWQRAKREAAQEPG